MGLKGYTGSGAGKKRAKKAYSLCPGLTAAYFAIRDLSALPAENAGNFVAGIEIASPV
jgi:hypothetical protein